MVELTDKWRVALLAVPTVGWLVGQRAAMTVE